MNNKEYKEKLVRVLAQQRENFKITKEDQYDQIMKMNGWTKLEKVSLLELLAPKMPNKPT